MRYQMNTYVDLSTLEAVKTKASTLGVTQGDLLMLYVRHAERTMKPDALLAWAASLDKARPRLGLGPLKKGEAQMLAGIARLMQELAPQWRFDSADLQRVVSQPPRELFRYALALRERGLAEVGRSQDLDRWGRPLTWSVALTAEGKARAGVAKGER